MINWEKNQNLNCRSLFARNPNGETKDEVHRITEIFDGSGIPVHQLYASIEMAKNWKLVSSRIDKSSYPNRNLIGITEKGKKAAGKLREFLASL